MHTLSSLPLPPRNRLLIHNLIPDPLIKSVAVLRNEVLTSKPSLQRRARILASEAHFSYLTPFLQPFPYEISAPDSSEEIIDKVAYVESWLSDREAKHPSPTTATPNGLALYKSSLMESYPRELLGISPTGLRDCLPHLDIGDCYDIIGSPALQVTHDCSPTYVTEIGNSTREELVDILSGKSVLMSTDESMTPFAPWSLRYSGHQFGSWAGQLGDGRAISIAVTPDANATESTWEIQLKGSGRTPFSRSADGLAVLRSSIREYLCAEAMHALGIPTTRSLALISLPELPVHRETIESACVLSRMAPSFLRIGNFQALNGPQTMYFFGMGGGQAPPNFEGLRILGEWVADHVLTIERKNGEGWGRKLVLEVARRNAVMVAGWQAYGFMHGVMNTDNISLLGLTIDYGPYAFMDVWDPWHVCNHTDSEGRYAYKHQPNMIIYACRALLNALAPLIGAEIAQNGKAVTVGWADLAEDEQIARWTQEALADTQTEMEVLIQQTCSIEYGRLLRKRLGLARQDSSDESNIFKPLLDLMEEHKMDFHGIFRKLCFFDLNQQHSRGALIESMLGMVAEPAKLDRRKATDDLHSWLTVYSERLRSESEHWSAGESREVQMKNANPRFILRQWLLEEVIARVEQDAPTGKRMLAKVLHMACNPFDNWGAENSEVDNASPEVEEERRFCGLGKKSMLGFQCSCSS